MARVKVNPTDKYESVIIIIDKEKYPIAYQAKIEELVEQGCSTIEDVEKEYPSFEIDLELYYDKHSGLFGVESGAIESCAESICSPYTGEYMIETNED